MMGQSETSVLVELSRPSAMFLVAVISHLNDVKALPPDDPRALETSAWLEEIAAQVRRALDV